MEEANMPPLEIPTYPRIWPFVMGLLVLIPLWVVALNLWSKPALLQPGRAEMGRTLALYLIPPVLTTGALLGVWFGLVSHRRTLAQRNYNLSIQEVERQKKDEATRAAKERDDCQFTLEVLGLGLSVEKFRQQGVWQAIEQSGGAFILPTDPKSYAWSEIEKGDQSSKRGDDAFEHAASYFTEKWLCPGFAASASNHCPENEDMNFLKILPDALRQGAGMAWHKFANLDHLYDDAPEGFFERVFRFFDENPDVPAAVFYVEDGMIDRNCLRPTGSPRLLGDGYRKPTDMTESMVAFVLARPGQAGGHPGLCAGRSLEGIPLPRRSDARASPLIQPQAVLGTPKTLPAHQVAASSLVQGTGGAVSTACPCWDTSTAPRQRASCMRGSH